MKTIYQVNLRTAYAAVQWARILRWRRWSQIPQIVEKGAVFWGSDKRARRGGPAQRDLQFIGPLDGKLWRVVVKATADLEKLRVATFLRTDPRRLRAAQRDAFEVLRPLDGED